VGREEWCATQSLRLAELAQHLVDRVEHCVYILPHLHMQTGTSVWAMASELVSKKRLVTFAPVRTIFPDTKMRSTTLGLIIR